MATTEPGMATRLDRRRAAMLQAGEAVFLERGFEGATLGEIISRSGGSRTTLYEQFGGKEGLFAAIIAELCTRMLTPLAEGMTGGRKVKEILYGFGLAYMKVLMTPSGLALYRMVISESGRFPELGARVFTAGPEAAAIRLADYLKTETKQGRLAIRNADEAARSFLEMVKGDLHTRAFFQVGAVPRSKEIETAVQAAVALFLDGATPRK